LHHYFCCKILYLVLKLCTLVYMYRRFKRALSLFLWIYFFCFCPDFLFIALLLNTLRLLHALARSFRHFFLQIFVFKFSLYVLGKLKLGRDGKTPLFSFKVQQYTVYIYIYICIFIYIYIQYKEKWSSSQWSILFIKLD